MVGNKLLWLVVMDFEGSSFLGLFGRDLQVFGENNEDKLLIR